MGIERYECFCRRKFDLSHAETETNIQNVGSIDKYMVVIHTLVWHSPSTMPTRHRSRFAEMRLSSFQRLLNRLHFFDEEQVEGT